MKKSKIFIVYFLFVFLILSNNSYAVSIDDWAKPSYERLLEKNIIPDRIQKHEDFKENITRLEFTHLVITYLLSNKNYDLDSSYSKFKDVDDSFVNLASKLDIINGYKDSKFKPHFSINRCEATVIMANTENLISTLPEGDITVFKDYRFIPDWAVDSIASMTSLKVINGYPNKTFLPSKNITIQEAIVMVDNLLSTKKTLIQAFNISKDDEYLKKSQYQFIMSNIPISIFKIASVQKKIFETPNNERTEVYYAFLRHTPYSKNDIISSPDLIFFDNSKYYLMGMESREYQRKNEQRVFMTQVYRENGKLSIQKERQYSPWFIVEK